MEDETLEVIDETLEEIIPVPSDEEAGSSSAEPDTQESPEELTGEYDDTTEESQEEYVTPDMLESILAEYSESAAADEELVTVWDKPLEEYSVSEGLLLVIFIMLLWLVISRQIGGIFK